MIYLALFVVGLALIISWYKLGGGLRIAIPLVGWASAWPAWIDRQTVGIVLGVVAISLIIIVAFPVTTAVIWAAVGWSMLVIVPITTALLILLKGGWRVGLVGIIAILLIIAVISGPSCAPGDTVCIEAQRKAESVELVAKDNAKRFAEASRVYISQRCPGNPQTRDFDSGRYVINDNYCQFRAVVEEGCVLWYDSDDKQLGKTCKGQGVTVSGIYALRPDPKAKLRWNLCAPFAPATQLDRCA